MKESHEKLVENFFCSGEGSAAFLHTVTRPTLRRGRCIQILGEVCDDADPLKRVEEQRKEWSKQWQIGTEAQKPDDNPWKNIGLREREEGKRTAARDPKLQILEGCGNTRFSTQKLPFEPTQEGFAMIIDISRKWKSARLGRQAPQCFS